MPVASQAVARLPESLVGRDIDAIQKIALSQEVESIGDAAKTLAVDRGGAGPVGTTSLGQPLRRHIFMAAVDPSYAGGPSGQRDGAVRLAGHGHDLRTTCGGAAGRALTVPIQSGAARPGPRRGSIREPPESAWPCTDREDRGQPCPARRAGVRCAASRRVLAAAAGPCCGLTHRLHRGPARPKSRGKRREARRAAAHRPARDRASGVRRARRRLAAEAGATRSASPRSTSRDRAWSTGFSPERSRPGGSRMTPTIGLAP